MGAFFQELIHFGIYKRSQGRITRQVTFAAMAVGMGIGLWQLSSSMIGQPITVRFGVPGTMLAVGLWVAYRVVNVPGCADFLISVEAEMNKVSWPTRNELFRASMVVLFVIFVLAAVLTVFDVTWGWLFRQIDKYL